MKKYLEELEKELANKGLSKEVIDEIVSDHSEMIEEAIEQGLSEEEIENKFGSPKNIAEEVAHDSKDFEKKQVEVDDYTLYQSYPATSGYALSIQLIDEDFEVVSDDVDEIRIYYKGKGDLSRYDISMKNNEFSMKTKPFKGVLFPMFRKYHLSFVFKIPSIKSSKFNIGGISADGSINGVNSEEFSLKSTNGDMEISSIKTNLLKMDTVNGDIELKDIKAGTIQFTAISGDVSMSHVACEGEFRVNAVSGDIEIEEMECDDCSLHTVSGDLEGKNFYPNSISIKSVSGDIDISNDDKSRTITVKSKQTVSGDVNIGN